MNITLLINPKGLPKQPLRVKTTPTDAVLSPREWVIYHARTNKRRMVLADAPITN